MNLRRVETDLRFDGMVGSQTLNAVLEIEGDGERTDRHRSFVDTRSLNLAR